MKCANHLAGVYADLIVLLTSIEARCNRSRHLDLSIKSLDDAACTIPAEGPRELLSLARQQCFVRFYCCRCRCLFLRCSLIETSNSEDRYFL